MTDEAKKPKKTSPTQRSLERLREEGAYMVAVVEKWNRFGGPLKENGERAGNRIDLYGFIDVLAVLPDQVGTLGVQACGPTGMSSHLKKVFDDPALLQRAKWYVKQGNRLVFWSWKQDKKTKRWGVKERDFVVELAARQSAEPAVQTQLFGAPTTTLGKDNDPF